VIEITNILDGLESFVDEVVMRTLGKFKGPKVTSEYSHETKREFSLTVGISDDNGDDNNESEDHRNGIIYNKDVIITWQSFIKDKGIEEDYDTDYPLDYKQLDIEITKAYVNAVHGDLHFLKLSLQDAISNIYKYQIEEHKKWATENPTLANYHTNLSYNRAVIASVYNTLDHCIKTELAPYAESVHIVSKIDHYSDVVLSSKDMPGIIIVFDGITHGADYIGNKLLESLDISERFDGCAWYKCSHHLSDTLNNKKTLIGRHSFEAILELTGRTLENLAKKHNNDVLSCNRFTFTKKDQLVEKKEVTDAFLSRDASSHTSPRFTSCSGPIIDRYPFIRPAGWSIGLISSLFLCVACLFTGLMQALPLFLFVVGAFMGAVILSSIIITERDETYMPIIDCIFNIQLVWSSLVVSSSFWFIHYLFYFGKIRTLPWILGVIGTTSMLCIILVCIYIQHIPLCDERLCIQKISK
jgi:hypothetical protein